jgi:hypothetical protein
MDDTNMMDIPIASKHVLSNRTNNKVYYALYKFVILMFCFISNNHNFFGLAKFIPF